MYLGLELLGSLNLLPPAVAALLARHPVEFLYGSVAADVPMAKWSAPAGRHPHTWRVGQELLESAEDPSLRATALGYLAHLAADVGAHQAFVPRMLLLTASTRGVGHSYWEHRMDARVGPEYLRMARHLVRENQGSRADAYLDDALGRTLFSYRTNHRIFRGMVRLADDDRWQTIFDALVEVSRWELSEEEVGLQLRHGFELTAGFLRHGPDSRAARGDPTGEDALDRAKEARRRILRRHGLAADPILRREADRLFPLPTSGEEGLWGRRGGTPAATESARGRLTPSPRRRAV